MGGVFCGCPEFDCFGFDNPKSGWVVIHNAQIRVVHVPNRSGHRFVTLRGASVVNVITALQL